MTTLLAIVLSLFGVKKPTVTINNVTNNYYVTDSKSTVVDNESRCLTRLGDHGWYNPCDVPYTAASGKEVCTSNGCHYDNTRVTTIEPEGH